MHDRTNPSPRATTGGGTWRGTWLLLGVGVAAAAEKVVSNAPTHDGEIFGIVPDRVFLGWAAGVSVAVILLALAWRFALARASRRLRSILETEFRQRETAANAYLAERERTASEVQDRLLQGIHGLVWKFQALTERLPPGHAVRVGMDAALSSADRILLEGRDQVADLRATVDAGIPLVEQLGSAVNELALDFAVVFQARSSGDERALKPRAHTEVLVIGAELLRRAYRRHAARHIRLDLNYGAATFTLCVSEDGIAACDEPATTGKAVDWGIAGIDERASRIGAHLRVDAAADGVCRWWLELAADHAYVPRSEPGGLD